MGHNSPHLKQGKLPLLYPDPLPSFLQSKKQKTTSHSSSEKTFSEVVRLERK